MRTIILAGFLVGLIFSLHWLVPFAYLENLGEAHNFQPIHFGYATDSDDYFYYAKIRDVMDGMFLSFDPITLENRHTPSPHISYQGSYWLGAWSGLFHTSTIAAYCLNKFIFPFLCFVLCAATIRIFYSHIEQILLPSFIVTFLGMFWLPVHSFYSSPSRIYGLFEILFTPSTWNDLTQLTQLGRMPNIMVFAPVMLFLTFAVAYMKYRNGVNAKMLILVFFSFILNIICSTTNMVFASLFLFFFGLLNYKDIKLRKGLLFIFLGASPFLGLGLYVTALGIHNIHQYDYMGTGVLADPKELNNQLFLELAMLTIPILLTIISKFKGKTWVLTGLLSALVFYVAAFIRDGASYSGRTVGRGSDIVLGLLFMSVCLNWLFHVLPMKVWKIFSISLFIWMSIGLAYNQAHLGYARKSRFYSPELRPLCDWLTSNSDEDKVLVTIDAELLINLPACQPTSLYVPQALLSTSSRKERFDRYAQAWKFFGGSPEHFLHWLHHPATVPQVMRNRQWGYPGLMKLTMFYGQYWDGIIPLETDSEIRTSFQRADSLRFHHHLFLIGPREEELIRSENASLMEIENKGTLIATVSSYKIYRFLEK